MSIEEGIAKSAGVKEGELMVPEMLLTRLAMTKEECFIIKKEVMQEESKAKGHNLLVHKMSMHIGSMITIGNHRGFTVWLLCLLLGQPWGKDLLKIQSSYKYRILTIVKVNQV